MVVSSEKKIIVIVLSSQYCVIVEAEKICIFSKCFTFGISSASLRGYLNFIYGNCFYDLIGSFKLHLHLTMKWLFFVFELARGCIFRWIPWLLVQEMILAFLFISAKRNTTLKTEKHLLNLTKSPISISVFHCI